MDRPPPLPHDTDEAGHFLHYARHFAQQGRPSKLPVLVGMLRDRGVPEAEIEEAVRPYPVPITDPSHPETIRRHLIEAARAHRKAQDHLAHVAQAALAAGILADEVARLTEGQEETG